MTPNDIFIGVVKATTERLKPLGFVRRGQILRIVRPDTCGLVEFQRSTKSTQKTILFTINVGIVCGVLLDSSMPELPNARSVDAHVSQRIGELLPDREDKWWEITESTDPEALSGEIAGIVQEMAVPFILRYLSVDSIISLWESGQSPGITRGHCIDLLAALRARRHDNAK